MRPLIVGINRLNNSVFLAVNYRETCRVQIIVFYTLVYKIHLQDRNNLYVVKEGPIDIFIM